MRPARHASTGAAIVIPDDIRDNLSFAGACGLLLKGYVPLRRLPTVLPILWGWGLHRLHVRWVAWRAGVSRAELARMDAAVNQAWKIWR